MSDGCISPYLKGFSPAFLCIASLHQNQRWNFQGGVLTWVRQLTKCTSHTPLTTDATMATLLTERQAVRLSSPSTAKQTVLPPSGQCQGVECGAVPEQQHAAYDMTTIIAFPQQSTVTREFSYSTVGSIGTCRVACAHSKSFSTYILSVVLIVIGLLAHLQVDICFLLHFE